MSSKEQVLQRLKSIRANIAELKDQEYVLKERIHEWMDEHNVDQMVARTLTCTRRNQRTERMSRKDTPDDIWAAYATSTEHQVLTIKKN